MLLTRYLPDGQSRPLIGLRQEGATTRIPAVDTMAGLLRLSVSDLREVLSAASDAAGSGTTEGPAGIGALPPVDGLTEVWAAGVTYKRSREARVAESVRSASIYELVYEAERPELFFKATSWRSAGDGDQMALRRDASIHVPEPELAVVCNAAAQIVGYTIVNDLSSRDIEGENPLYLPQAKVWLGSCAVGPGIRPAWEIPDPYRLGIAVTISREGTAVWSGQATTADLRRRLDDLVEYLFRDNEFPDGVVLATGTSLVPDLSFTLMPGDEVAITIDEIGTLRNPLALGTSGLPWTGRDRAALAGTR